LSTCGRSSGSCKKIEDDPSNPLYLLTDVYVGYRFADAQMFQEASLQDGSGTAEEVLEGERGREGEDVPEDEHEPPKVGD